MPSGPVTLADRRSAPSRTLSRTDSCTTNRPAGSHNEKQGPEEEFLPISGDRREDLSPAGLEILEKLTARNPGKERALSGRACVSPDSSHERPSVSTHRLAPCVRARISRKEQRSRQCVSGTSFGVSF